MTTKEKVVKIELPKEAYAIVGDPDDPTTWLLPHHTKNRNVNWASMDAAAAFLSLQGVNGKRVSATPQQILDAARHLAAHYVERGRTIPWGLTPFL
jgi:hypothetical protein